MMPAPVRAALERVIPLLVAGQLSELEALDRSGRMRADEWSERLKTYGRRLIVPPPGDFDRADVIPIKGREDRAWSVWYRLHTAEEGRSDLQIELTVRYEGGDDVAIDLDDLRVA